MEYDAAPGLADYPWTPTERGSAHEYLLLELNRLLDDYASDLSGQRVLDLGCGNRAVTACLGIGGALRWRASSHRGKGCSGHERPTSTWMFHQLSAYDPLREKVGSFHLLSTATPAILTYDSEPNVGRTLSRLEWAERLVVGDSGSEDRTRRSGGPFRKRSC